MNIRIAILAACAGTLVLAQINLAQAAHVGAAESTSLARTTEVGSGPATMLAQSIISTSRSNIKYPSKTKSAASKGGKKQQPIADQAAGGVLTKKKN